jgi:hypothetical protein
MMKDEGHEVEEVQFCPHLQLWTRDMQHDLRRFRLLMNDPRKATQHEERHATQGPKWEARKRLRLLASETAARDTPYEGIITGLNFRI